MKSDEQIPEERSVTIRQGILSLLEYGEMTVGEFSRAIGQSEKELYVHLEHLLKSKSLLIIPAECLSCGFVFKKREKVKKPGKCPICRKTYIQQPMFAVVKK